VVPVPFARSSKAGGRQATPSVRSAKSRLNRHGSDERRGGAVRADHGPLLLSAGRAAMRESPLDVEQIHAPRGTADAQRECPRSCSTATARGVQGRAPARGREICRSHAGDARSGCGAERRARRRDRAPTPGRPPTRRADGSAACSGELRDSTARVFESASWSLGRPGDRWVRLACVSFAEEPWPGPPAVTTWRAAGRNRLSAGSIVYVSRSSFGRDSSRLGVSNCPWEETMTDLVALGSQRWFSPPACCWPF
jgi:hypothetical protein